MYEVKLTSLEETRVFFCTDSLNAALYLFEKAKAYYENYCTEFEKGNVNNDQIRDIIE